MRGELRRQTLLLLSAAAGATLYIFYLWYGKPGLTLAYLCALVIHLSLAGVSWRRIVALRGDVDRLCQSDSAG